MGNKLKLNSRISQAICTSLKNGNYLSTSARAVGISEASVRSWIAQGSTPNAPKIFKDFVDYVERAQAEKQLEYDLLKAETTAEMDKMNEMILIRDERIISLEKQIKPQKPFWWMFGGFVIVTTSAIATFYSVKE